MPDSEPRAPRAILVTLVAVPSSPNPIDISASAWRPAPSTRLRLAAAEPNPPRGSPDQVVAILAADIRNGATPIKLVRT
jgi:hypothetical protein